MKKPYTILFASTDSISIPLLRVLFESKELQVTGVLCQPDRKVGRKQVLTSPPPKKLAEEYKVPVYQPERLSQDKKLLQTLQKDAPDLILTFAYGQILNEEWLRLPKFFPLNVHASLLPKYRGAAPLQAALLAGDLETGICLMKMEKGLDTGPVSDCFSLPLAKEDHLEQLEEKIAFLAASTIPSALLSLLNGSSFFKPQKSHSVSYAHKISKEDAYVDFSEPASVLIRKFKAYTPWPGLWTLWRGKRVKILDLCLEPSFHSFLKPAEGKLVGQQFFVGTSKGNLEIISLQVEGKAAVKAYEFAQNFSGCFGQ